MELSPVEKFTKLTKLDVQSFLDRFSFFVSSRFYTDIYDYYGGVLKEPNAEAFEYLKSLEHSCNSILSQIKPFKKLLTTISDINLLYQIEDAKIKLKTVRNLAFFLNTNVDNSNGVETTYVLAKNENLQDVSDNVLNNDDFLNDWVQIALKNRVNEISYNKDGGLVVNLVSRKDLAVGSVQTVLGSQVGSSALGKDIQRRIEFEDNDVKILGNVETFLQSLKILLNLQRGDIPSNPRLGITTEGVMGSNLNTLNFPITLRELANNFAQDDTIESFRVLDLERKNDYLLVNLEVTAITGNIQTVSLSLT